MHCVLPKEIASIIESWVLHLSTAQQQLKRSPGDPTPRQGGGIGQRIRPPSSKLETYASVSTMTHSTDTTANGGDKCTWWFPLMTILPICVSIYILAIVFCVIYYAGRSALSPNQMIQSRVAWLTLSNYSQSY